MEENTTNLNNELMSSKVEDQSDALSNNENVNILDKSFSVREIGSGWYSLEENENSEGNLKTLEENENSDGNIKALEENENSEGNLKTLEGNENSDSNIKALEEIENSEGNLKTMEENENSDGNIKTLEENENSDGNIKALEENENSEGNIKALKENLITLQREMNLKNNLEDVKSYKTLDCNICSIENSTNEKEELKNIDKEALSGSFSDLTLSSENITNDDTVNLKENYQVDYEEAISHVSNLDLGDVQNSSEISEIEENSKLPPPDYPSEDKDNNEKILETLNGKENHEHTEQPSKIVNNLRQSKKRMSEDSIYSKKKSINQANKSKQSIYSHVFLNDAFNESMDSSLQNPITKESPETKAKNKKAKGKGHQDCHLNLKEESLNTNSFMVSGQKIGNKTKKKKRETKDKNNKEKVVASFNNQLNDQLPEICNNQVNGIYDSTHSNETNKTNTFASITQRSYPSEQGEAASNSKSPSSDSGVMELAGPSKYKSTQPASDFVNSSSIDTKESKSFSDHGSETQILQTVVERKERGVSASSANNEIKKEEPLLGNCSEIRDRSGELPNTPVYSDSETSSAFRRKYVYNYLENLNSDDSLNGDSENSSLFNVNPKNHYLTTSDEESEANVEYASKLLKAFQARRRRRCRNRPPNIDVEESINKGYKPPSLSNFDTYLATLTQLRKKSNFYEKSEEGSVKEGREIKVEVSSGSQTHDIKVNSENKIRILVEVSSPNNKKSPKPVPKSLSKKTVESDSDQDIPAKSYPNSSSNRRPKPGPVRKQFSLEEKYHAPIINNFVGEQMSVRFMFQGKETEKASATSRLSEDCNISVEGSNIQKCFSGHSASVLPDSFKRWK
ncbi:hypothetical protein Avbf_02872 [Armadillidium vulgare]|nr:hypothetical protein Avbf_02872 [Armadillidium vulgare]